MNNRPTMQLKFLIWSISIGLASCSITGQKKIERIDSIQNTNIFYLPLYGGGEDSKKSSPNGKLMAFKGTSYSAKLKRHSLEFIDLRGDLVIANIQATSSKSPRIEAESGKRYYMTISRDSSTLENLKAPCTLLFKHKNFTKGKKKQPITSADRLLKLISFTYDKVANLYVYRFQDIFGKEIATNSPFKLADNGINSMKIGSRYYIFFLENHSIGRVLKHKD